MYLDVDINPELLAFITKGEMDESDLGDIVMCIGDINQHHDDELVFLLGSQQGVIELFGCPSEEGLIDLAIYCQTFLLTTPSMVFRGTIQNPKELPYEAEEDNQVLILFADHQYRIFYRMMKAVGYIETCLKKFSASDIDDFAVIVGKELDFDVERWNHAIAGGLTTNGWTN